MSFSPPWISSSSHPHRGSSSFLSFDLEESSSSSRALQEQLPKEEEEDVRRMIREIWKGTGTFLRHADDTLSHLEEDEDSHYLIPQAILRKSQELADGVGWVARELEQQSPSQQAALAQACVDDYESTLALIAEDDDNSEKCSALIFKDSENNNLSSPPTQEDFLMAIQGASTLLRDVESAFRDLTQHDAEDLADAGLTLARLFLLSLQNFYDTLTPEDFIVVPGSSSTTHADRGGGVFIEELDEEEENNTVVLHNKDRSAAAAPTPLHKKASKKRTIQNQRVKILWPRLGPQVQKALQWTQHEANQRPLLAVALGFTLWPAAFVTTLVGGSLVLADHVVQDVYQHFQEGPILSNLEQGAAQVVQVGKLGLVTTTILGKQTWRVMQRQVQRRGGVEQIMEDTKHMAVDRLTHPMESLGMAWKGVVWSVGALQETVQQVLQQREEWQNDPAVQEVSL